MATFQGQKVSRVWWRVLTAADKDIDFRVNDGRRSMADQWRLYRMYLAGTGNLAAFPNPNAPHIWLGRPNHALDIDQYAGDGEQSLQNWLIRHGVDAVNNVAGEGWHIYAPLTQLLRLAHDIRRQTSNRVLKLGSKGRRVRVLRRRLGKVHDPDTRKPYIAKPGDDKTFGKGTKEAVIKFQKDRGLVADGIVGPITWRKLKKIAKRVHR